MKGKLACMLANSHIPKIDRKTPVHDQSHSMKEEYSDFQITVNRASIHCKW